MKPNYPALPKTTAEITRLQSLFVSPRSQVPGDDSLMDWSKDIPEVQSMPMPRASPTERNVPSSHAPLPNRDAKGKKRADPVDSNPLVLNYGGNQPAILSSWKEAYHALSIFRTDLTAKIDAKNMAQLITQIIDYIRNNMADKKASVREFEYVAKGFWSLIQAIYSLRWDLLHIENGKNFRALVGRKILNNYAKLRLVKQPEVSKPQPSMPNTTPKPTIPMPPPSIKTMGSNDKKAPKPSVMECFGPNILFFFYLFFF